MAGGAFGLEELIAGLLEIVELLPTLFDPVVFAVRGYESGRELADGSRDEFGSDEPGAKYFFEPFPVAGIVFQIGFDLVESHAHFNGSSQRLGRFLVQGSISAVPMIIFFAKAD